MTTTMTTMMIDSTYLDALVLAAAVLSIKLMVLHLLAIRSRLMSLFFATTEDNPNDPLLPFVKMALMGFGSDFGGQVFVERIMRITRNCAENEPHFLILALLCGLAGNVPTDLGVTLIQVFTLGRVVHTILYLLGPITGGAPRSIAWTVGCSATLGLAYVALANNSIVGAEKE